MVMLQAYIDDSHASSGLRPLYLAAYAMEADRWIEFSDAWDAVLNEPPAIDYFKMTEAMGCGGCFRGFSEPQRNKKVLALASVIKDFAPWGMHMHVNTVEFDEIFKPHAPPPLRSAYFSLCYGIMNGITHIQREMRITEPCEFIFDDHPGLAAKVVPIFDFMMDERPEWAELVAGMPSFKDDKDVMPLQACDMLAWVVRRESEGLVAKDFPDLIDVITAKDGHYSNLVTRQTLEDVAGHFKQSMPGAGSIKKKDWDAMMQRLHNSRALALWLLERGDR